MFLKVKSILIVLATLVSVQTVSAQSQVITTLEEGQYSLIKGEKHLCSDFKIQKADLFSKKLSFGGFYRYEVENSDYNVESDLDANCVFKEQNRRVVVSSSETNLIRINEEICKGQTVSRTTSTATLRNDEVQVRQELNDAEYTCVWKKN